MDLASFCRQTRILLVVGKGGVGKSTCAAALALGAAQAGLRTLLTVLDDSAGVHQLFSGAAPLDYEPQCLFRGPAELAGRLLTSDAALLDYLAKHGLGRLSARLVRSGALDVVATAIPGIREVLVLAKLKQIEKSGEFDLIVLDAPASGRALSFLTSSGGLLDAARGGPLREQAGEVVELLADPSRCQVLLVTIPEETPVNEVVESAFLIEDEAGVALAGVIVNACYPVRDLAQPVAGEVGAGGLSPELTARLDAAASFRRNRQELEAAAIARLGRELPLPHLRLPYLFTPAVGPAEIGELALVLGEELARW